MTMRRPVAWFSGVLIALTALHAARAEAAAPILLSAVSRMPQGNANFDVQLPLTGGSGIECRAITNGVSLVLTFNQPVTAASVAVTGGVATAATPTFSTNVMTVKLTGLVDAEAVAVTLSNVTNAAGETLTTQAVNLRTLFGDINGDGRLTGTDSSLCRAAIGAGTPLNAGNFRCDVNADGTFSGTDSSLTRAAIGAGATVDGGPTANTPPTLSTINAQTVATGTAMSPVGFTVGDTESDPATLVVSWTTSDQVTIPNANITVSGTGASRQITLTPAAGVTSNVPVTVNLYVSDGLAFSDPATFTVTVTPPPMTYLATLGAVPGTGSLGSGSALLTVSGDQTYATLVYSYSNLTSADSDDAVYDGTGGVMYDIPVGKARGDQQTDGSYKWVFNATKTASIVASLQANTSYILLESANFPAGELTGIFKPLTGSQTFTPPAAPPSITISPPSPADASRFMQQAGFGGNTAEIAALSNSTAANASTALQDWLAAQFAMPVPVLGGYANTSVAPGTTATSPTAPTVVPQTAAQPYTTSSMYWQVYNRICQPQSPNNYADPIADDRVNEVWWKNAVTAPDPLRQRVATALSEIFVISENDDTIDGSVPGLAAYYDMLAGDAFGNFRTLLGDVTLNPLMGHYLNMAGSTKTTPNENYAREIMQLFTIGLYMLQPDGTLMLDSTGQPIPTYTQPQVTSFAAVYTGWNNSATRPSIPTLPAPVAPATTPTVVPFVSYWQLPMSLTTTNHSTVAKTLLNYPGVATTTIPATTGTPSATVVNAELNTALDNIFNHPNVGPFICKQLIQRLVESNPSPAYVYRVAQVFNNNGSGVRGDLKAVVNAILTDYEARSTAVQSNVGYGHMREPVLRFANILHSLNAYSKTGKWAFGKTDATLAQTIFRSPTVFNFFDPAYAQPGVVQGAGLVSPEFDIIYETTITNAQNMIYTGIYASYNADGTVKTAGSTGWRGDAYGSDIYLDFSAAGNGLVPLTTASGTATMLSQVILLLAGNPIDPKAVGTIQAFLDSTVKGNPLAQAQAAVHLVATSAQVATAK